MHTRVVVPRQPVINRSIPFSEGAQVELIRITNSPQFQGPHVPTGQADQKTKSIVNKKHKSGRKDDNQ